MEIIKTTYEIRYPFILDFRDVYKKIINPFFIYPNAKYAIGNEGTRMEFIRMTFPNSNHLLFFHPDKITFVYDGEFSDLEKKGNVIKRVFDILEKLSQIATFTETTSEIVEIYSLNQIELSTKEIVSKFRDQFVSKNVIKDPLDLAILEEGVYSGLKASLQYGPFLPDIELDRFDLFSIDPEKRLELKSKQGLLCKVSLVSSQKSSNYKSFLKMGRTAVELTNKIFKNYEFS